jgi:ketosteroid isomerase-like protein
MRLFTKGKQSIGRFPSRNGILGAMAESQRVGLLREAYAAFNRGEVDEFLHLLDENVDWRPPPTSVEPQALRGRDAVRAYLAPDMFEEQTAEPVEVLEDESRILVAARVRARGRESGVELDQTAFHLWTVVDDRAVRFEVYLDREQAFSGFRNESEAR